MPEFFAKSPRKLSRFVLASALLCLAQAELSLAAADLVAFPTLGLRVARGFRVTLFADDTLASDIYALTIDPRGNVVVTSQGYIRTLLDRNNDGVAETVEELASTTTGGMGLGFGGNDLMFVGDGGLWRFRDENGDGRPDGPPEKLLSIAFAEHGGHAVRKGPDGAWYLIGGNDSKFDLTQINASSVPGRKIEGGVLLRLGADGRGAEVIAHGFRNPYDFDFNAEGDVFTYDSDCERDYFLPWYTPTRLYHIAPGGHHGWRLEGYLRSWARRDYFADTVGILAALGRGSPTGVACYDHLQFPERYRGGVFALDWTFGRVYFLPLVAQGNGSTYQTAPEVFLESIGTAGFAPTDVAVGPEGSLYISSGGRKSRGAVYRVQYTAEPARVALASGWQATAVSDLHQVLIAPQPLEAWSRALWIPMAERLGPEPFAALAADNRAPSEHRVRAIEILTEIHGGLAPGTAAAAALANAPVVRARVAWSLGVAPAANAASILLGLARDLSPYVRCRALEALRQQAGTLDLITLQQALAANLGHPDTRVHQTAAWLATDLSEPAWKALWRQQQSGPPQARLTTTLAQLWRDGFSQINTAAVESALAVLGQNNSPDLRSQALRLIMLGFGDYRLERPSVEVYTAYESALSLAENKALVARLQSALTKLFPSGDETVDFEAARLLAVIQADDPSIPAKLAALISDRSTATADFHYLIVFSRLKTRAVTNYTAKVANAVLSLDRKLSSLQQRPKQTWDARLDEVVTALLRNDGQLADALMRHAEFSRSAHLHLVTLLGSERYLPSARLFFNAVRHNANFPWSEPLVELLSALPADDVHPLFRRQLSNLALRDRLLIELASKPLVEDRDKFVAALGSARPDTVRASMSALLQLPNDTANTKAHIATLRVLRGLLKESKEQTARAQAVALLSRLSGQRFAIQESGSDLTKTYQPVFDWFVAKYPGLLRQLDSDDQENQAQWDRLYKSTPWTRGDASRGATLFSDRGCGACHAGLRLIGPDLAGSAQRLAPVDLMNAIVFPSRDIAPAYRMTTFTLRDGRSYTGLVAFESADGVIIHTGIGSATRLAEADIVSRQPSNLSFMPSGLLAGINPQGLADLYAYLRTLQASR
jgi:putative membrane-bound dehydrogenase-like protein